MDQSFDSACDSCVFSKITHCISDRYQQKPIILASWNRNAIKKRGLNINKDFAQLSFKFQDIYGLRSYFDNLWDRAMSFLGHSFF